jgi:hypothetical protein
MTGRWVLALVPLLLIAACGPSAEQEQELAAYLDELQEVTQPGYSYCIFLEVELSNRNDIPELLQCNDDSDPSSGQEGIVVAYGDQTKFFVENGLTTTFETAFAPLDAMANSYNAMGAGNFESVDLFLVFFDDECRRTWEVQPSTLAKLGAREISLEQAAEELDLYEAPNCP